MPITGSSISADSLKTPASRGHPIAE